MFLIMDTIFEFFSPSKHRETSLSKNLIGPQVSMKNSNSLLENMPIEYRKQFIENSLYDSDFNNTVPSNSLKTNFHNIFRTLNHNMLNHFIKEPPYPNLIQESNRLLSKSLDTVIDSISDLNFLYSNTMPQSAIKEHNMAEVASEGSSFSDLVVIADVSSPNKKAHFNLTISKSVPNPFNKPKKFSTEDCNLTQQMANRKTKEMQKRSKKRRRRQKKSNSSSTTSQNRKIEANCGTSPNSASEEKNCDILCDVTLSHNSKSVQIVLPNLSSFVVTIESGDDDSDWDTNGDCDWLADDSDFQVSGLFVASFSATNACSSSTNEPDNKDQELSLLAAKLKEVNKIWNEEDVHLQAKPKSSTLVSFADDEELEEICPVEMYERKGEWEIFAIERLRFKKRVSELEEILNPCLLPEHRAKIYSTLYENVL